MKKALLAALCALLMTGALLAGARTRSAPAVTGTAVTAPAAAAESAAPRRILYYVDPMHPAYRSDKPGIAPDCGMPLQPVYADEEAAAAGAEPPAPAARAVRLDDAIRQRHGVRLAQVERTPTAVTLRLFGRVVPDETRVYSLDAATDGSIRAVSSIATGSQVHKGQWLASFFSTETRTAMQAYITALDVQDQDAAARERAGLRVAAGATAATSAQFTVERLRGLGMSAAQIGEIRRRRMVPVTIDIHAPADGFVLSRNVSLDQKFERGAEWYRIADLDRVWILTDLFGGDASLVHPGTRARILAPGGAPSTAVAADALPQLDPVARTVQVRFEADNPAHALLPGAFVELEVSVERPPAVTIPADALLDAGIHKTVFVQVGEGLFQPRAVETGWRSGDRIEIVSGLAPGERIVASGTFLVDSESRLRSTAAETAGPVPASDEAPASTPARVAAGSAP